jgi:predicted small secreted protein
MGAFVHKSTFNYNNNTYQIFVYFGGLSTELYD